MNQSIESTADLFPSDSQPGSPLSASVEFEGLTYPSVRASWAIAIASVIALGITAYLVTVAMSSSKIAGCGGGQIFDCNDVVNSRWSRWLGLPVSVLALGLYLSVLTATVVGSIRQTPAWMRSIAWTIVILGGLSAGLAAIWFTSLQIFVVKHLCNYCLAAHTCGLFISGILIWTRPLGIKTIRNLALLSLVGFGMLGGGQLLFKPVTYQFIEHDEPSDTENSGEIFEFIPPADSGGATDNQLSLLFRTKMQIASLVSPSTLSAMIVTTQETNGNTKSATQKANPSENPVNRRLVSVQGGSFQLDINQWPLLGKPDAKHVFIEMFDYTCDHCRRTHVAISAAKQKLGDDLAVIVLPVPLNTKCNSAITATGPRMAEACEIAQLAIAFWRVAPVKFPEFHEYLMTTPGNATFAESKAKAIEMLGNAKDGNQPSLSEKLETEFSSQTPSQYIAQHVKLYQRFGSGTVPKLMFPGTTIVGEFTSGDALLDVIQKQGK